jgi:aspartate ammonia-lyase
VNSTRKEHDSLGQVDVPEKALYGAQTVRALQNFPISGKTAHPSLTLAYLWIKEAAACVNSELGVLSKEAAELITHAVSEVTQIQSSWNTIFPLDPYQAGAGTSQNMNVNEVLANLANRTQGKPLGTYSPVHPNDHVNRSQSTNDTYPTAMRLAILRDSRSLVDELRNLSKSFSVLGKKWDSIPKSARTHLQDAVPMRLGQEFRAYTVSVEKCAAWIELGRDELRALPIGGSAAGTGLNTPPGYAHRMVHQLEKLSGEKLHSAPDLIEAMRSQAPIAYYSSMLRLMAIELTRICNDLRLMASGPSTGLAEIIMPAVQPGSSIMPGKVNPSIVEMANQTWFSVMGYDHAITQCVQAGQLELNVMMPMMAYSALEATNVATTTLRQLRTLCIDGLEANEARLRRYFESTSQIATALTPKLGYETVAGLVREAVQLERSVLDLVRERKLMSEDELAQLIDLKTLTGP